jgi:hypothetical protein
MKDLRRFQSEKEDDLRRYMVNISTAYSIIKTSTDTPTIDGVCTMPHRLGETEQGCLGRSES